MLDKLGGYKTEIRILEKKLKEMDHSKLSPAKVKEVTEAIKNLKDLVKEKEDKRQERRKKKEEASKAATEVEKEAAPEAPQIDKNPAVYVPESLKQEEKRKEIVEKVEKDPRVAPHLVSFKLDDKVVPVRGNGNSWGIVMRSDYDAEKSPNGLVYVSWQDGDLKSRDVFGGYYGADLQIKAEEVKQADYEQKREEVYNLEADLKSNYEQSIKNLEEEHKTALEKGEAAWAYRLEEKINDLRKAYDDRFPKTADIEFHPTSLELRKAITLLHSLDEDQLTNQAYVVGVLEAKGMPEAAELIRKMTPEELEDFIVNNLEKEAENENGSGGTTKLKVVDFTPNHDKDPQEKEIGYGGDRAYGWQTAPKSDESSLPLESSLKTAKDKDLCWYSNCNKKSTHSFQGGKDDSRTGKWCEEHFKKLEEKQEKKADLDIMKVNVGSSFYNVTPGTKNLDSFSYDVADSLGTKLFKIDAKQELNQEHLAQIIETETKNKKEAVAIHEHTCPECGDVWKCHKGQACNEGKKALCGKHYAEKEYAGKKSSLAKLTANLAFLKKGTFVSIISEDKSKKQVKFASLDNSLRGWAPSNKFAAFGGIEQKFMDHEGHKDEVFAESGNELLVACPQGTTNITWRTIEAPPATPESLNPDVTASTDKVSRGCDQCEATMINGVFCHETGCPNARKELEQEEFDIESSQSKTSDYDVKCVCDGKNKDCKYCKGTGKITFTGSLNIESHIRHEDGKWIIYSHDYKKKLGTYDTKKAAEKRLAEIEAFKHMKGSLVKSPEGKVYRVGSCNFETDMVNLIEIK